MSNVATRRPHVLMITMDQWAGRVLGSAGHPVVQTPTLDALARSGVRYPRAYSECPVCIPARRVLMTGRSPRSLGSRTYREGSGMPADVPSLAQTFREAGYQTCAVGKLHTYPQRDRIGFDDVWLVEEGRTQFGVTDDYEQALVDAGYPGQQFAHGMANNGYETTTWHLPDELHVTTWTTRQMARQITRRDPTRPGFWYLSYTAPHPPLVPPAAYAEIYRDVELAPPMVGDWCDGELSATVRHGGDLRPEDGLVDDARRAYYAMCTHIDHQLRLVIGTLREQGILDDTIILITADHGEMLGQHRMWSKRLFYDPSANVPMILLGPVGDERIAVGTEDDRLVGLQDVMPTLLDLAGVEAPTGMDGRSMVTGERRAHLYGELGEGDGSFITRMVHDGRHKLIYYPIGNQRQLFDLVSDPDECVDLAGSADHAGIERALVAELVEQLYGDDRAWVRDGDLIGVADRATPERPTNRALSGQRGLH